MWRCLAPLLAGFQCTQEIQGLPHIIVSIFGQRQNGSRWLDLGKPRKFRDDKHDAEAAIAFEEGPKRLKILIQASRSLSVPGLRSAGKGESWNR